MIYFHKQVILFKNAANLHLLQAKESSIGDPVISSIICSQVDIFNQLRGGTRQKLQKNAYRLELGIVRKFRTQQLSRH